MTTLHTSHSLFYWLFFLIEAINASIKIRDHQYWLILFEVYQVFFHFH